MVETPSGIVMDIKFVQYSKAQSPIAVIVSGRTTEVKPPQFENTDFSIVVTFWGISIVVILQSRKAPSPMVETPWGISNDVKFLQTEKANFPILVTVEIITL